MQAALDNDFLFLLYDVARSMSRFAANPHGDPGFWKPAPLLARLAAEGKSFNEAGRPS